jgi:hypothetical protein
MQHISGGFILEKYSKQREDLLVKGRFIGSRTPRRTNSEDPVSGDCLCGKFKLFF